jgi:hypothetical protein
MNIELLTGIVGVVGAVVAIILPILKRPHEARSMDASAAKSYMEAAKMAAQEAKEAKAEMKLEYEAAIAHLEERISVLEEENLIYKDLAERRGKQVVAYGGTPARKRTKAEIVAEQIQ